MKLHEPADWERAGTRRPPPTVLVVDDEVRSQDAIRRTLDEDYAVLTAGGADAARELLGRHEVAVILCDQRMPGLSGVAFLKEVRERWPDTVRIVISGYTDSEDIIAGINDAGIYQYVLKPWLPDHLLATVEGACEARRLRAGIARIDLDLKAAPPVLRRRSGETIARARDAFAFERIERAPGSPLDEVCDEAARVARYDLSVLVLGESGTGKELLARAIHYASPRAGGAFVVENCAAMPDTLLESELFGHKRGAFTGAYDDHVGLFQRADRGTVFLDEIGETSPAFQVRLLRVLQEGEVRPVGATRAVPVDVRVIAATHRDLEHEVRAGRFREDLYYRLAGLTLTVAPLRERAGDIPLIARRLVAEVGASLGRPGARLTDAAIGCLMAYPWPGNIRELRNEIGRAVALSDDDAIGAAAFSRKVLHGPVGAAGMAPRAAGAARASNGAADARAPAMPAAAHRVDELGLAALAAVPARGAGTHDIAASANGRVAAAAPIATPLPTAGSLQQRLDAIEAAVLREVLLRHRWNRTRAAQELGLSRVGLRAKMQRFGLDGH